MSFAKDHGADVLRGIGILWKSQAQWKASSVA